MTLPPDFQFSQSSLQDYMECPRRFQLRYVERLAWPAIDVEPIFEKEQHMREGNAFHRILHQHQLGLPVEPLLNTDNLKLWWRNFEAYPPPNLPETRYAEITLSAKIDGLPLLAKYDLIAIEPDQRAVIVDWKTTPQRPKRQWVEHRWQTRVYRYLLVKAGLNQTVSIQPEQVEMVYWYANFPDEPEIFTYSQAQYDQDERDLVDLMREIADRTDAVFTLTDDERKCRFCRYRSLCERGRDVGTLGELQLPDDQISDIIEIDPLFELEF